MILQHKEPEHKRELGFMLYMAIRGKELFYEPRFFRLSDGTKYTPDFYCPKEDTYYELVGTRQAWDCSEKKIRKFMKEYPEIKFNVVKVYRNNKTETATKSIPSKIKQWIRRNKVTQKDFARILGISEPHLSQVINGKALPSIRLAILIERKTGGAVTLKDYSINGKRAV